MTKQKKPVDPDCELTTKRYVKTIARIIYLHDHKVKSDIAPIMACVCAIMGWILSFALVLTNFINNTEHYMIYVVMLALFSIAMTTIVFDHDTDLRTYMQSLSDIPDELKDHINPKKDPCEKTKE